MAQAFRPTRRDRRSINNETQNPKTTGRLAASEQLSRCYEQRHVMILATESFQFYHIRRHGTVIERGIAPFAVEIAA
jgi:hypothetical protein